MPALSDYPVRRSFFIHIRRAFLQGVDFIGLLNGKSRAVRFPVRFVGRWDSVIGTVEQVNSFPDGQLVLLTPTPGSLLQNWPRVKIWVPKDQQGPAGVLCFS